MPTFCDSPIIIHANVCGRQANRTDNIIIIIELGQAGEVGGVW